MARRHVAVMAVITLAVVLCSARVAHARQRLVVDTDMGFDVDDVVATCLANSLHDTGDIELLAVVHNTGCKLGIGGVSAINNFYGHNNVTLGAWKGKYGSDCYTHFDGALGQDQYLSHIIGKNDMRGPVTNYDQVMLGTKAYRKVLSMAPDNSVNVASIGMPTNLRDLLNTTGDEYSSLSGYDLVAKKINQIVFMDGMYNFGCADGLIGPAQDCYGSAQAALKMPPSVSMVFSGEGASPPIYTGGNVQADHPPNSPCREALKLWCCNPNGKGGKSGRLSWDPIATMIASIGVGSVFEKQYDVGTQVSADAAGHESFFGSGTRNARTTFTDATKSPSQIPGAIDDRLKLVPSVPPSSGWTKNTGDNCYGSRNGQPAHGAKDLENPVWAAAGGAMTIAQCQMICAQTTGCTGITVQHDGGDHALYDCYRKADIVLSQCDHGTYFDTWTINSA